MKWVTREHPHTDRIACPWLIRRFIDAEAEIVYVPATRCCRTTPSTPGPTGRSPTELVAVGSCSVRASVAARASWLT